jgi:P4 family phage/plasmid primase-like protien
MNSKASDDGDQRTERTHACDKCGAQRRIRDLTPVGDGEIHCRDCAGTWPHDDGQRSDLVHKIIAARSWDKMTEEQWDRFGEALESFERSPRIHETLENEARERATERALGLMIVRQMRHQARWVPGLGWHCWDGDRLVRDEEDTCVTQRVGTLADGLHRDVMGIRDAHRDSDGAPIPVKELPDEVRREVVLKSEWARMIETGRTLRSTLGTYVASESGLQVPVSRLDHDPNHLVTPGGRTLELRTSTLIDSVVEHHNTHIAGVAYEAGATSTTLDDYVRDFWPDGDWPFLMKALGLCLYGGNPFRLLLVLLGPTTTGKSMLTEAIERALGDYATVVNASVFRGNMEDKPRPDLLRAMRARTVFAYEASNEWELHGDHVKRMTGDSVTARGMRSNVMVTRTLDCTCVIVANAMPRIKDADPAVRRRLLVMPSTHSVIATEDVSVKERFVRDPGVRRALLAQLADGCRRAFKEGLADMPQAWVEATARAYDDLSHVAEMLGLLREEGQLAPAPDGTAKLRCVTTGELHRAYASVLRQRGTDQQRREMLGSKQFTQWLGDNGYELAESHGTRVLGWVWSSPVASLLQT